MNASEKAVFDKFKSLILERLKLYRLILCGSRARGDAGPSSDMDVVVILEFVLKDIFPKDSRDYPQICQN
ncbi:MAG: nucleotidyltransferase domain-containing protein [Nitrospirae bacterium]|nr:nucleotidyltransferase domain-containing protein [Nitrospirota bacterium]